MTDVAGKVLVRNGKRLRYSSWVGFGGPVWMKYYGEVRHQIYEELLKLVKVV